MIVEPNNTIKKRKLYPEEKIILEWGCVPENLIHRQTTTDKQVSKETKWYSFKTPQKRKLYKKGKSKRLGDWFEGRNGKIYVRNEWAQNEGGANTMEWMVYESLEDYKGTTDKKVSWSRFATNEEINEQRDTRNEGFEMRILKGDEVVEIFKTNLLGIFIDGEVEGFENFKDYYLSKFQKDRNLKTDYQKIKIAA